MATLQLNLACYSDEEIAAMAAEHARLIFVGIRKGKSHTGLFRTLTHCYDQLVDEIIARADDSWIF